MEPEPEPEPSMERRRLLLGAATVTCVGTGVTNWRTEWSASSARTSPVERGPTVGVEPVATGFDQPLALDSHADSDVLYVADKTGTIHVADGEGQVDPMLDIRDRMAERKSWEQGLLGFALHPSFGRTRKFYVRYSAPKRPGMPEGVSHTFVLSEFVATPDLRDTEPDSERTVLEIPQQGLTHNAGGIAFGPDGCLYVGVGDGESGNGDRGPGHASDWYLLNGGGNGQNVTDNLLGSVLRVDVDDRSDGKGYAVPDDNPLVGRDGLDEQYAWGFRNPYTLAFDGQELYVGDVGQSRFEEINRIRRGGNYGWNVREGRSCFSNRLLLKALAKLPGVKRSYPVCPRTTRSGEPLVDPVVSYPHHRDGEQFGAAVVAGYRYRGTAVPALDGEYVFGDLVGGVFVTTPRDDSDGPWPIQSVQLSTPGSEPFREQPLSFGRDTDGEMYVLTTRFSPGSGRVWKFVEGEE
ncbi:sorbosone dehydrogenase family protein [Salinigranum sp.]|uniref:PQQ-dependent sugar dehydrogenase n=1 Tax=Salinigranum sp. TaxID=1966351 RepID=UPI003562EC90